jgi:hypothetical protein
LVVQFVEQHDGDADGDDEANGDGQALHQPLPDLALFRHLVGTGFLAVRGAKWRRANGGHRMLGLSLDGYSVIVRVDHPGKMAWRPYHSRRCA